MTTKSPSFIPLPKALAWIAFSVFIISGSCALVAFYIVNLKQAQKKDPRYNIIAIVQSCCNKDPLKTSFLADLLKLSIDNPSNLYNFDQRQAEKQLLEFGAIKAAAVKKIKPGTLFVKYELREPIAYLSDYDNSAIDAEGILIPFHPFYTPKNIPEISLGIDISKKLPSWGDCLFDEKVDLAFSVFDFLEANFSAEHFHIERIDVSQAFSIQKGKREIVIFLTEKTDRKLGGKLLSCSLSYILRLPAENYQQQLYNFFTFSTLCKDKMSFVSKSSSSFSSTIIADMRIQNLAFIKKIK